MKKDCVLIATLPSLSNMEKVENVFKNPYIKEVRFNTGVQTPYDVEQTLELLTFLSQKYNKRLWIDIKGRQLRVAKWADPVFSCIELNHRIQLKCPAQISFRNGDTVNITHVVGGKKIFVDPLPRQALGKGQSVNIISNDLVIDGYLTNTDKEYLSVCKKIGLNDIMASFVEDFSDFSEILKYLPKANIIAKVESQKGIKFIMQNNNLGLMAARDDLYLQTGQNHSMLNHLKNIIAKDKNAICASKIFLSLEHRENVEFSDFADLELMYSMGYRRFMLCDNICNYRFDKAIKAWEEFIND